MSIEVALPDGSSKQLDEGASALDLAKSISHGLAKKCVIALVNEQEVDLNKSLHDGDKVQLVTKEDQLGLETLRHSAAHLMAAAILQEFPKAQLTIGPVTEDGFYYDIFLPEGEKITEEDFPAIEKRMAQLVKANLPFSRCVADSEQDEIFQQYRQIDGGDNKFKAEIVDGLKENGAFSGQADAPEVSFYKTGDDFIDLCRGPHVPSTKWLKHTKLMRVSGSYWRADQSREQLTRVYGTSFFSAEELEAYLNMLEEARKRDHRVLGEQLDLFHFEEDAPGMPFFHGKGATVFNLLMDFMRTQLRRRNYQEVRTPLILSESLWHTSGHYENYLENMFFTKRKAFGESEDEVVEDSDDARPMAVKPMNCPGHVLIYKKGLRSHHDLPLRMGEMGMVHRRELSGVRHGLFRVQQITQDDAHHFCTPEQIHQEIQLLIEFFFEIYRAYGLVEVELELSTRPEKSVGSDEVWEKAEAALEGVLEQGGFSYKLNPGDGAFYGPKIDFHIKDALGRRWQCGTIQLDFSMPQRFGMEYVGADGARHTPVMIHRACYGSLERFMGIVIEHFAGALPLWLAPVQVQIIPVSEKFMDYAKKLCDQLAARGLRVEVNTRDDRVGYKIREASLQKIPYAIVVGEKEEENGTVNPRSRDKGEELGEMSVQDFIDGLEPWNIPLVIESLQEEVAAV